MNTVLEGIIHTFILAHEDKKGKDKHGISGDNALREVRGAHPLHPDEAFGEVDAGGCGSDRSDSLRWIGQRRSQLYFIRRIRRSCPEEEGRESVL